MSDSALNSAEPDVNGSRGLRSDQVDEVPYPELAQDIEGVGWWASLERWLDHAASWLNPILIKEARQSLKSRQFILTFFLMLTASAVWTLVGVVLNAPDVYYVPTGDSMLAGYYLILAIPMMGLVPLAAYRSLAAEIDDDTFEMLVITRLSSMRIVLGKLNSAMLQMLIYFAAIVPCLAFAYLLRGISLPTIVFLILIVFMTAILLTSFALMLATLAPNRFGQTMVLLTLILVIFFAEVFCASFCIGGILSSSVGQDSELIQGIGFYALISAPFVVLFVKAAAARVASVTENRSTGLRWCMFVQQLLWIGVMAAFSIWAEDTDVLNFANMLLGGYWLTMGTLMLAESPELSPRVQRGLPSTFLGRALLTWFNPGPGTGYVFAIASGSVGAIALGIMGSLVEVSWQASTDTRVFAVLIVGYLLGYLGIVRLTAMPISRRLGNLLVIPIACCFFVLLTAAMLPSVLMVLTTGSPSYSYTPLESIDWIWSLNEAFDRSFDPALALLVLIGGILITVVNLALLFREFEYRRITVPRRVEEDRH